MSKMTKAAIIVGVAMVVSSLIDSWGYIKSTELMYCSVDEAEVIYSARWRDHNSRL